jgi:hypothetical protein
MLNHTPRTKNQVNLVYYDYFRISLWKFRRSDIILHVMK